MDTSYPIDTEAGQRTMERQRLGIHIVADERAARANRYELSIHRQENVKPRDLLLQVLEALNNTDSMFDVFLHDAVRTRDEALIGKLVMRALTMQRHCVAEGESEQ